MYIYADSSGIIVIRVYIECVFPGHPKRGKKGCEGMGDPIRTTEKESLTLCISCDADLRMKQCGRKTYWDPCGKIGYKNSLVSYFLLLDRYSMCVTFE